MKLIIYDFYITTKSNNINKKMSQLIFKKSSFCHDAIPDNITY